jgi:hypothetical protein
MEILQEGIGKGKWAIERVDDLILLSKSPELFEDHFILKADLNMKGIEFLPIGNLLTPFNGSFDGNGMFIENLTINCPQKEAIGLFGCCDENANIQGVRLTNCNITGADGVGGICGFNQGGRIEYCEVYGTIRATEIFNAIGCVVGCSGDGGIVDMNVGECTIITDKEFFTDDLEIGYDNYKIEDD